MGEIGPGKSIEQSYQYTAYGVAYSGSLSDANQYGYTGKQFDPMVGLYNFGFRDYNPQRGVWTTQDPIHAGLNWYAYVDDAPTDNVDLWGLLLYAVTDFQLQETPANRTAPLGTNFRGDTIALAGCFLTGVTRIANTINTYDQSNRPHYSVTDANATAIKGHLFLPDPSNGQIDNLSTKSSAGLIKALTGQSVSYNQYNSTTTDLQSKLDSLNSDSQQHYVLAKLDVYKVTSSDVNLPGTSYTPVATSMTYDYSHFVNVQGLNDNGQPIFKDTSRTNRTSLSVAFPGTVQRLSGLEVFTPGKDN